MLNCAPPVWVGSEARRRGFHSCYTRGMKTAISVPDEIFEDAEALAARLGKSRSQLYAEAMAEYLARHDPETVTERMDRVLDSIAEPEDPFAKAKEDEWAARYGERKQMLPPSESVYKAEEGYWGAHVDHFHNFFAGMREGRPVIEDAAFGFRAAAPALICNDCLAQESIVRWDPESMRVV